MPCSVWAYRRVVWNWHSCPAPLLLIGLGSNAVGAPKPSSNVKFYVTTFEMSTFVTGLRTALPSGEFWSLVYASVLCKFRSFALKIPEFRCHNNSGYLSRYINEWFSATICPSWQVTFRYIWNNKMTDCLK